MKLVVGLGNPGEEYEGTRHNLGFFVIERFFQDFAETNKNTWTENDRLKSEMAVIEWQSEEGTAEKVILAKPRTYMNNSGQAVSLLANFYKVEPKDIWVIHDELDLPLGTMRIRFGGAAAGHHGVESIINSLGTDQFWRFRLGIGRSFAKEPIARENQGDVTDYVLGKFDHTDAGRLRELVPHAAKAIETALEKDMETAMNRFNTK